MATVKGNCWVWGGSYFPGGYGQVWSPALQRATQAHRFVYEQLVGPIPEGLQVDHLCRNRSCVNPEHMQIVDCRTNIMAPGSTCEAKRNAERTHCPKGHEYNIENTYIDKRNKRYCRICKITNKRISRQLKRIATSAQGTIPALGAAVIKESAEAVTSGTSSAETCPPVATKDNKTG